MTTRKLVVRVKRLSTINNQKENGEASEKDETNATKQTQKTSRALNKGKNEIQEINKQKNESEKANENKNSCSNGKRRRNLSKYSAIIESLLESEDEHEEHPKPSKYHIFTSRTHKISEDCNKSSIGKPSSVNLRKNIQQSIEENNNEYDFLSLSQNSPHIDPTADVVRKLIKEGKAQVATHKKGSGKLVLKRQKKINVKLKPLRNVVQSIPAKDNNLNRGNIFENDSIKTPNRMVTERQKKLRVKLKRLRNIVQGVPTKDNSLNRGNIFENDSINTPNRMEVTDSAFDDLRFNHDGFSDFKESNQSQVITNNSSVFSPLAKNLLINQSKRIAPKFDYARRKQLLDVAINHVSTPLKDTPNTSRFLSPLRVNNIENGSPWRVNETYPRTFYLTSNSFNAPSFSSDNIRSTPKKQSYESIKTSSRRNKLSSYPIADSNLENQPPVNSKLPTLPRPLGNPVGNRSPLKTVNIVSVQYLPPWKSTNQNKENINKSNEFRNIQRNCSKNLTNVTSSATDLFGFEEYLSENDEHDDNDVGQSSRKSSAKSNLKKKLKMLRKLKTNCEPVKKSTHQPIKAVLDDGGGEPHQMKITDMLCSTMIDSKRICDSKTQSDSQPGKIDEMSVLFEEDSEPEHNSKFNASNPVRNYVKKRKRKLRHKFLMFEDSEESDNDEQDKSSVKSQYKRKKNIDKNNAELDSFVKDFNSMVQEVQDYQLVVE